MGRRGPVRQLRPHQGTNFVGAINGLQQVLSTLNHEKIRQELLSANCDWIAFKMNPPHVSHIGGVWEHQIRTIQNVLASLLRQKGTQLDGESLRTFMVEAEAIVNCCPLTVDMINTAPTPQPLTPNHLLTMKSNIIMPPQGDFQRPDLYSRKRWRRVQYLANEFLIRWRQDYLQSLQPRQKWMRKRRNMQVSDIVIVKHDNLPRNLWKLVLVKEAFVDSDALVRKVKLRVTNITLDKNGRPTGPESNLYSPIHKLIILLPR